MRVSGTRTADIVSALTGRPLPAPRVAARRRFGVEPVIDDGLLLWFPAPASFTGEDVAELHVHGGRAVWQALAAALVAAGGRPAEPGEFTRRAFGNDKLDLTQAEAIADLVAAETEAQRRQARRQLDGALGALYEDWRNRIVGLMAHVEAAIDFPEDDLPDGLLDEVRLAARDLAADMGRHLDDGSRGQRLRDGIHVAIIGAPNAGKSSLLNALVGRSAAIVHPSAGTTRDVVEVAVDLSGWPVVFSDTAGLRDAVDPVEAEGVHRARMRAETADICLLVTDVADSDGANPFVGLVDERALVVLNKCDLSEATPVVAAVPHCRVSAATGEGIAALGEAITARIVERFSGGFLSPTRERHRLAVAACVAHLDAVETAVLPELLGEELRLAARNLGIAVGRIGVEDILDRVFREFCIGK